MAGSSVKSSISRTTDPNPISPMRVVDGIRVVNWLAASTADRSGSPFMLPEVSTSSMTSSG